MSSPGHRAASGPCIVDGLGTVIAGVGCLLADEAAPGGDWSTSDPNWDALEGVPFLMCGVLFVLMCMDGHC